MASDQATPKPLTRACKVYSLSHYPIKRPTYTTFSKKSLKNAVDFRSEEKSPCKNTWYRDLKATHIRNKRLLDLPFHFPKCCSDVYNITLDRQKLKKLQKLGLTRPVRTLTSELEPEEVERCIPKMVTDDTKVTLFPECFLLPEDSSDEEDEESVYELCRSNSVSQCSGCSTLGDTVSGVRLKRHKVEKKDWRSLLHFSEKDFCQGVVEQEVSKHKEGRNFPLKMKKFL